MDSVRVGLDGAGVVTHARIAPFPRNTQEYVIPASRVLCKGKFIKIGRYNEDSLLQVLGVV